MYQERKFTLEESNLMKRLVTELMVNAPSIKPKSLFVPIDQMEFHWKHLPKNQRIDHPIWVVKTVYVRVSDEGTDMVEHILRMVPHLIRQLYEQMDYKEHRIAHTLNHICYHDRLGNYRQQYKASIKFYKILLNAYRYIKQYEELGRKDPQDQYDLKKELTMKYGKGFELAMEIYTKFHIK